MRLKGSLSHVPAGYQFLMLCLLVFTGGVLISFIGALTVPLFFPISWKDFFSLYASGVSEIPLPVLKYLQAVSSLAVFLVPGFLAAYLFSFRAERYLAMDRFPGKATAIVLLLIVLMLSSTVVSDLFYRITRSLEWHESLSRLKEMIDHSESLVNSQIESFLKMENLWDFAHVFFIMAILPAVCEEILFRGVLQPVLVRGFRNKHLGIWLTAFCFALFHMQFYTFLSILVLGALLGYMKQWSGSLWVAIAMHLVNNGTIVIAVYFFAVAPADIGSAESLNLPILAGGVVVFLVALATLYRILKKQSPPEGGL